MQLFFCSKYSHPGPEHWNTLGSLIGYLKVKEIKGIIIRNPKFLEVVMFCDYNYSAYMETRESVSSLVATLEGTLIMCLSKTQRGMTLSSTEVECLALSACVEEVKFVSMLQVEMTKMKKFCYL